MQLQHYWHSFQASSGRMGVLEFDPKPKLNDGGEQLDRPLPPHRLGDLGKDQRDLHVLLRCVCRIWCGRRDSNTG